MNNHQLRRWLSKEILGKDIPRKPATRASALGGKKTARNWKYKLWIRSLPCAVCGCTPTEAAHTGSDGGMSMKASDYSCIPLCADCHTQGPRSYHRIGRPAFELEHDIQVAELVARLNRLWFKGLKESA